MRRLYQPIFVLLLLLSGCGAIIGGMPTPDTTREQLAALEISYQETNLAIQDLVVAGTLHGEAAARVWVYLNVARDAMRAARAGIDSPDGLALLGVANQALIGLTVRLREESL